MYCTTAIRHLETWSEMSESVLEHVEPERENSKETM